METQIQQNDKNTINIKQFQKLTPQQKIYNRYFHLRKANQDLKQKQHLQEIKAQARKPKLNTQSYQILIQSLEKQINQFLRNNCQKEGWIDFENFQKMISTLNNFNKLKSQKQKVELQILNTQLWLLLIQYEVDLPEEVQANSVIVLMHALMNPFCLTCIEITNLIEEICPHYQQKKLAYISSYPESSDQLLQIQNIVKLWLKLKNSCPLRGHYTQKEKKIASGQQNFNPKINDKSRLYAEKSMNKYLSQNRLLTARDISKCEDNQLENYIKTSQQKQMDYFELLHTRKLQKDTLLKTSHEKSLYQLSQPAKTMRPEQVKEVIDNLYVVKPKRSDVDYGKIFEEKELKKCTFKPIKTEYRKRNYDKSSNKVKDYEKQILRQQKARDMKLKAKETYDNLGKVMNRAALSKTPPKFIERDTPKLILEIRIDQNRVQQIKLKGSQDPRITAKKFVLLHNLQIDKLEVIESLIEEQLQSLHNESSIRV